MTDVHTPLCRSGVVPCHEKRKSLMKMVWLPLVGVALIGGIWAFALWRL